MGLEKYVAKRDFRKTPEPQPPGRSRRPRRARRAAGRSFVVQKHAATPAPLRLPPRARRRAEELGGAEGPLARSGRQAPGGGGGGSPARVRRLRRGHPQGAVRRRRGAALGPRHLGARGGRRARRLRTRQAGVPARRREAARPLAPGPHAAAAAVRRQGGAKAARRASGCCASSPTRRRGRRRARAVTERAAGERRDRPHDRGDRRAPASGVVAQPPRRPQAGAGSRPPLPGAQRAALPRVRRAAARDAGGRGARRATGWLHEIKLDGYRILCRLRGRRGAGSLTRNAATTGPTASARSPRRRRFLPADTALLDGEVVWLRPRTADRASRRCRTRSATGASERARLLRLRPAPPRRLRPRARAARGAQGGARGAAGRRARRERRAALQRPRARAAARTFFAQACRLGARGHRLQARRRPLPPRPRRATGSR